MRGFDSRPGLTEAIAFSVSGALQLLRVAKASQGIEALLRQIKNEAKRNF
jgi:hypothetical protein